MLMTTPKRRTVATLAALTIAGLPLLSACGDDEPVGTPSAPASLPATSIAPSEPASSPSQASPAPSSAAPSPSSSASAKPSASEKPSASASPSAARPSSAKPSASASVTQAIALPDEWAGWMKIERTQEGRWTVAGYTRDQLNLQVRAARTPNDLPTVMRSIVGDNFTKDASGYCGQKGRVSACARKTGPITVTIASHELETEELSSLLPTLFEMMDEG